MVEFDGLDKYDKRKCNIYIYISIKLYITFKFPEIL